MKRLLSLVALLLVLQLVWPVAGAWAEGPDPNATATNGPTVLADALADITDFSISGAHDVYRGDKVTITGKMTSQYAALAYAANGFPIAAAGAVAGSGAVFKVSGPKGVPSMTQGGIDGGAAGALGTLFGATTGTAVIGDQTFAVAIAGGGLTPFALALVGSNGLVTREFKFTFNPRRAGRWTVKGLGIALGLGAAAAGSLGSDDAAIGSPGSEDVAIALALAAACRKTSFMVLKAPVPVQWKPVAEHVIFTGLPADTQWGDLRRLELDGTWVPVPPLHPVDSLPNPVHADLMVQGYGAGDYALRVCNQSGTCQPPRYFSVNPSGSQESTIVSYPDQATELSGLVPPVF